MDEKTFETVTIETIDGPKTLIFMTDVDGKKWGVPDDPGNVDYQAYLEWSK